MRNDWWPVLDRNARIPPAVSDVVRHVGVVNRITRRATILVESATGVMYTNGKRYQKFYVPLGHLQKPRDGPG